LQWMHADVLRERESDRPSVIEHCARLVTGQTGQGSWDTWMRHRDQPCTVCRITALGRFDIQRIHGLRCSTPLIEPRPIHGLDLALLHPGCIGIVADGGAEEIVLVDQVRPIYARRDDHGDGLALHTEPINLQPEYRRRDRSDRDAAIGALMTLGELPGVTPTCRSLPLLLDAIDNHPAATV